MQTMIKVNSSRVMVDELMVWEDSEIRFEIFGNKAVQLIEAAEGEVLITYSQSGQEWTLTDCGVKRSTFDTNGITTTRTVSGIATDRIPA